MSEWSDERLARERDLGAGHGKPLSVDDATLDCARRLSSRRAGSTGRKQQCGAPTGRLCRNSVQRTPQV